MKKCIVCLSDFESKKTDQRFCSVACSNKAKVKTSCQGCGRKRDADSCYTLKSGHFTGMCKDCENARGRARFYANREAINAQNKVKRKKIRLLVLEYYGSKCACCQESIEQFLTIDHIKNNGADHRRKVGIRGDNNIYKWLIKNNFPEDFQVLCYNCNCAKHHSGNGECPHLSIARTAIKETP